MRTRRSMCPRLASWLGLLALCGSGCNSGKSELREWTPKDHANATPANSTHPTQSTGEADPNRPEGLDDVTLATWKQNCVICHGQFGRGDGPQGPLLKAKDLTTAEFQASQTDVGLMEVIRKGREKMPSFAQLPESTIVNLVKLIRLFGRSRTEAAAPTADRPAPSSSQMSPAPSAGRPIPPAHAGSGTSR